MNLQLPIFTGPLLRAGVEEARAAVLLAQSNQDATLLAIRSSVSDSLIVLHEQRAQMVATREPWPGSDAPSAR